MNKIYGEGVWESATVAISIATLCTQASLSKGSEPSPGIPLVYLLKKKERKKEN